MAILEESPRRKLFVDLIDPKKICKKDKPNEHIIKSIISIKNYPRNFM